MGAGGSGLVKALVGIGLVRALVGSGFVRSLYAVSRSGIAIPWSHGVTPKPVLFQVGTSGGRRVSTSDRSVSQNHRRSEVGCATPVTKLTTNYYLLSFTYLAPATATPTTTHGSAAAPTKTTHRSAAAPTTATPWPVAAPTITHGPASAPTITTHVSAAAPTTATPGAVATPTNATTATTHGPVVAPTTTTPGTAAAPNNFPGPLNCPYHYNYFLVCCCPYYYSRACHCSYYYYYYYYWACCSNCCCQYLTAVLYIIAYKIQDNNVLRIDSIDRLYQ